MTTHYFVLVFLTVAAALERMDASLEEAARVSGARTAQIIFSVTLPLVLPAVLAGGLLTFIGALANFGIPALLGMRARFFVLTTSIYYALSIPDFALATALSMMLAWESLGVLFLGVLMKCCARGLIYVIASQRNWLPIMPYPMKKGRRKKVLDNPR